MTIDPGDSRAVRYQFLVAGKAPDSVLALFPELRSAPGAAGGTVLFGQVEDAAHLHGILGRLQSLGVPVLEMRQLPD